MSGVKIQLSAEEQEMVSNSGIILTKNRILAAVMELLGEVSKAEVEYLEKHRDRLPAEVFSYPPKIARGENYQQLPWLMLDYPRVFQPEASLAVRQFFWWGNFFSVGIQVSGRFKKQLAEAINKWPPGSYICVQASPWEHHFGSDNYQPVAGLSTATIKGILEKTDFLKLSMAIPVSQWEAVPAFLLNGFICYLDLMRD